MEVGKNIFVKVNIFVKGLVLVYFFWYWCFLVFFRGRVGGGSIWKRGDWFVGSYGNEVAFVGIYFLLEKFWVKW